ncbi:AAA family ATPase [Donghicola sp. C2-DW-16]|uniref:AAA family ATPase n=1 Tax=Donghicola mangrovi TaxID=2729614 RepID=A0ABX2PKW4_9RHOB|nr:AAA family ATPase [Donghicola mangrovi]NVO29134.1 AAA family ATPase [Donghicola mangrovi]
MYEFDFANSNMQPEPKMTHAPGYVPQVDVPFAIKGLFNLNEVSMIAGAPALGKTNIVAAACAHAAQGRNFGGRPVRRSVVVYYGAEDPEGVLKRAHPILRDPACATAPFFVVHEAPNLMDPNIVSKVRTVVERKKAENDCDRAVVVFDTLNRCLGGADENLSSTMGTAIGHADQIAKQTNACVVLIHHVGTGNTDRPRGSSAQESNLDGLYMLKPADDCHGPKKIVLLVPKKQKNDQNSGPIPFEMNSFFIGRDSDGDEVTVPYAVALEPSAFAKSKSAANYNRKTDNSRAERREDLARTLGALRKHEPERFFTRPEIADRSGDAFNTVRDNKDSLRKAIGRALDDLVADGRVESNGDGFRRAPDSPVIAEPIAETA